MFCRCAESSKSIKLTVFGPLQEESEPKPRVSMRPIDSLAHCAKMNSADSRGFLGFCAQRREPRALPFRAVGHRLSKTRPNAGPALAPRRAGPRCFACLYLCGCSDASGPAFPPGALAGVLPSGLCARNIARPPASSKYSRLFLSNLIRIPSPIYPFSVMTKFPSVPFFARKIPTCSRN